MTDHEASPRHRSPQNAAPGRVLVTLVTYNERDNLETLAPRILEIVPHATLLVVDDNSPDGTGQWCDAFAEQDSRLRCLHRPAKAGVGSATKAALQYAVREGFETVVNLDADWSHPPERIPDLLDSLRKHRADIAIGSRYASGGGVEGWPWTRRWMSRMVNWHARFVLGIPAHDCSGAFRGFRVAFLKTLDWSQVRSNGYAFEEELLWRLKVEGAVFTEIPITFVDRREGRSKTNLYEVVSAVASLAQLTLRAIWPRQR